MRIALRRFATLGPVVIAGAACGGKRDDGGTSTKTAVADARPRQVTVDPEVLTPMAATGMPRSAMPSVPGKHWPCRLFERKAAPIEHRFEYGARGLLARRKTEDEGG